jgi:8-oxo-dGTP diphosphatase
MRKVFSVAIFVRRAGRVLLVHHRRLGLWLPIGGEINAGETPLEAARRELYEETNLKAMFTHRRGALEGEPPGLLGYEEHLAGEKGLHMNFVFVADVLPSAELLPNVEFDEWRWLLADDLEQLTTTPTVRYFTLRALHGPS